MTVDMMTTVETIGTRTTKPHRRAGRGLSRKNLQARRRKYECVFPGNVRPSVNNVSASAVGNGAEVKAAMTETLKAILVRRSYNAERKRQRCRKCWIKMNERMRYIG